MLVFMEATERIAQWENMTQADPENSMGWLSLGTAYKEAGRPDDAIEALRRAIDLDQGLSRAYQLLGQILAELNRQDEAASVLTTGYTTAAQRGDVMPQKAMGTLLEQMGQPVPQTEGKSQPLEELGDVNMIVDRRTGRPGPRMADPPMRGPLGRFIFDHFSQPTWTEWISMGTKVINELRLDFSDIEHQKVYDQQMMEWLGIDEQELETYTKKTEQG